MSKDLYVKNISLNATEEDLRKLFALCGKVSYIHLVNDSKTGLFVGAGYVKMSSEAEAKDARVTLDGTLLLDRIIVVTEALPRSTSLTKAEPAPPTGKQLKVAKPTAWDKSKADRPQPPGKSGKPARGAKPKKMAPSASGKSSAKRRPPR